MDNIVKLDKVKEKIIELRNMQVIIDSDVAALYGVETRDINKAVKNNPEKFPAGYVFEISPNEKHELVEIFHQFNLLKHSPVMPKAFTEKGLYMLATILKSAQATQTTIAIVEAFAKLRELAGTVAELAEAKDEFAQKTLMHKGGEIMADILGEGLQTTDTETCIELNFALLKLKHTIKRKNNTNT